MHTGETQPLDAAYLSLITYEQFNRIRTELRSLGARTSERRSADRVALRYPMLIFPVTSGKPNPRRVCLKDISRNSMGIISREPFNVGDEFVVKLSSHCGESSSSIYCIVSTCTRLRGGIYSIGAIIG